ncbi:MAG TPA: type II toxin-antitoxin system VapC family toxin [Dinghuibacter sp.]|jgi:predicted nucleic acid-binding protein|uniref:type II toxin-antitoxin system VapC family toxin n=1 Tax=Dinghuibacter sp. TaxID=2024697 RepID=UPI002B618209|nr:type II toxin-antitoxin system VapC family toxin [Dinghuibacter sp.]HTJ13602.1 type II toxin-antitoxin system VapC family toxin [Dinghuibacter sp.]
MVMPDFSSKVVFLDTAPLIYFIEGHSDYQPVLKSLFASNDHGDFTFITSSITLLEVLVKPIREGYAHLVGQYREILLNAPGIEIYEIDTNIAIRAAELRAKYGLRTPDALQIATALEFSADYFLTNDTRLRVVSEIRSVTLPDLQ